MPNLANIRKVQPKDAPEMAALLNEIIEIGGTTAFEDPLSSAEITETYIHSENLYCCFAAVDDLGKIAGFQALESNTVGTETIGYISTFARQTPLVKGVGTALFKSTKDAARRLGLRKINAKIRADNVPGLAYYSKMGFVDHDVVRAVPLKNGTPVDRIVKLFDLAI